MLPQPGSRIARPMEQALYEPWLKMTLFRRAFVSPLKLCNIDIYSVQFLFEYRKGIGVR
jgi:hypothetical protein